MKADRKNDDAKSRGPALGRRDLMKIGAGVVMTSMAPAAASAQEQGGGARRPAARPESKPTGPGFKYTANRLSGNGPMDETMKRVVTFAKSYTDAQMTPATVTGLQKILVDTGCAWISGFYSEPGRNLARMARLYPAGELKSTVAGYGVSTTPDMAAYANSFMVRDCDYNDGDPPRGGHASVIIPAIIAAGESVHASGAQVMAAIAVGYEFLRAGRARPQGGRPGNLGWGDAMECTASALACGKLLGLNEDRLANAVSLAVISQLALGKLDGTQSNFKAGHSAIAVSRGVHAAISAREGITGPNAPFNDKEGLFDLVTGVLDIKMPAVAGEMAVDNFRVKRYPIEGNAQAMVHQAVPPVRKWMGSVDQLESIHLEVDEGTLLEIADPECWDPSNRETADHSLPYLIAVALTDGDVYLDAFMPKRYLHDPALRQLMGKITCSGNDTLKGTQGKCRWTVKKKSGETMNHVVENEIPINYQDVVAKFDRVCEFMKVPAASRDKLKGQLSNLRAVKDIGEVMATMARLVPNLPINERAPYASDVLA